jgi:hypothetical protein
MKNDCASAWLMKSEQSRSVPAWAPGGEDAASTTSDTNAPASPAEASVNRRAKLPRVIESDPCIASRSTIDGGL